MNRRKYLSSVFIMVTLLIWIPVRMSASEKRGRPVRIVSLCFENEDFSKITGIIDNEGAEGTDVIILPETWQSPR